jgi:hypothetical protein
MKQTPDLVYLDHRLGGDWFGIVPPSSTVALFFVIIIQILINEALNVRLAKYNKIVQLVFYFIYI